jgi:hypothetical protein
LRCKHTTFALAAPDKPASALTDTAIAPDTERICNKRILVDGLYLDGRSFIAARLAGFAATAC